MSDEREEAAKKTDDEPLLLNIRVTLRTMHPYHGSTDIQSWDYSMHEGMIAADQFRRLRKSCLESNGFEAVEIAVVQIN